VNACFAIGSRLPSMTWQASSRSIALVLMALLLTPAACRKGKSPRPVPPLPSVAMEDVPAPAVATVTVKRGDNLGGIAERAYGHERFAGLVGVFNGISDVTKLKVGAVLHTPSLSVAFRDAGLDARYQPALNALAKASADVFAVLPEYERVRNDSGMRDGQTFAIPESIAATFIRSADAIDAACHVLKSVAPPHAPPMMTVGQFHSVSDSLRLLSSGMIDSHDYDIDLIGQRFGLGFTNAMVWTKNAHQ
jgi:hypothetical protein